MKSFRDYLGLSNSCLYDVDDVIGRADRFGFQNFCSPAVYSIKLASNSDLLIRSTQLKLTCRSLAVCT